MNTMHCNTNCCITCYTLWTCKYWTSNCSKTQINITHKIDCWNVVLRLFKCIIELSVCSAARNIQFIALHCIGLLAFVFVCVVVLFDFDLFGWILQFYELYPLLIPSVFPLEFPKLQSLVATCEIFPWIRCCRVHGLIWSVVLEYSVESIVQMAASTEKTAQPGLHFLKKCKLDTKCCKVGLGSILLFF